MKKDAELIHKTILSLIDIFEILKDRNISSFIHAGSSSEYGLNSNQPAENSEMVPNSQYSVSKIAASNLINYYGKIKNLPAVNLRLYSVYGPYEDSSRLIQTLCKEALDKKLPIFANKNISRDFIFIDDVIDSFIETSLAMNAKIFGESFNVGTGVETTLLDVAQVSKSLFDISEKPQFKENAKRSWDTENWSANTNKIEQQIGWKAKITFEKGLKKSFDWWKENSEKRDFTSLSKQSSLSGEKNSISAIIACYKDNQAIPIMYERLVDTFERNNIDYEIIFVNDCSPDNSHDIIKDLSSKNPRVIGITHSRNFGSQAAFLSGMEIFNKESCVLLDGDLQDPPELIEKFIIKWREGYDVVMEIE